MGVCCCKLDDDDDYLRPVAFVGPVGPVPPLNPHINQHNPRVVSRHHYEDLDVDSQSSTGK